MWWQTFFDEDYLTLWGGRATERERTQKEVDGLWSLLGLRSGARVLDAPCGYGRVAQPLAARGAIVVGVDQSAELLAAAERNRDGVGADRLHYRRHDLRQPLDDGGFDVAVNLFSSIGYGSEDDDLAIFTTLRRAVRSDGRVFIETQHRDSMAVHMAHGAKPSDRLPDGTLVVEQPELDPIAGRVNTTWYWSGPRGTGQKSASIRTYSITELAVLLTRAELRIVALHRGCSPEPYSPAGQPSRVGILAAPV